MIGKCCVAAALLFACTAAANTSTTLDVPIVVTHGAPLTTFTFVNNSGTTLPAGTPVSRAQAFRYGDIMPGYHPVIQDAGTHTMLAHQQWNEISTWRENGGNNSWRHGVWSILLPNSLAANATYQIEFVVGSGAYSQSPVLTLSALCSGVNTHDLKIHLSDIRNQDDTVRQTGDATFRLCDNIATIGGRDDPRPLDAGSVSSNFKVVGRFKYTDNSYDPELFAECNVGLFVDPATGNSLKDVSSACWIYNSWMTVQAGSSGHAGNLGPAGLANDPQALSYRPEILDGSTSALNWSGLDATVSSASNPIVTSGCGANYEAGVQIQKCLNIPSSTGSNAWYFGQAVRITSTGTPVGGLTNGSIRFVYNNGSVNNNCTKTTLVSIQQHPNALWGAAGALLTGSQGTGATSFGFRVWHPTSMAYPLLTVNAEENWSPGGSATMTTREVLPALTITEKKYWEATGIITPLELTFQDPTYFPPTQCGYGGDDNYHPFARGSVIGGQGTGTRPDLGMPNDYSAVAFIRGTPNDWRIAKIYATVASVYPYGSFLDEASGRIVVMNNGPPTGPGGNGTWNSNPASPPPYAGLSIPRTTFEQYNDPVDYVYQRQGVPFAGPDWHSGIWFDIGYGAMDHEVNFQGFTYAILGSRHWLDELYMQGNRSYGNLYTGPAIGRRDDNASGTSPYHYWGLSIICCQSRGSARALWDKILPAGLGGDNNIERTYFNDIITENTNYYLKAWLPFIDGPGNYNYENGLSFVNYGGESSQVQIFIASYNYMSAYIAQTYLHSPLGPAWLPSFQRYMEWACGNEVASTRMPVFYCIDYATSGSIKNTNAQIIYTPNVGQYYNATDASDMAGISPGDSTDLLAGGQWRQRGYSYRLTNGDKIRLAEAAANANNLSYNVDQLADGQFRSISGVSTIANPNDGFYVNCTSADHARWPTQCPVVGQPFTGYTRNGTAIVNEPGHAIAYRPQYDPGPGGGFADNNYAKYGKMIINGLKILGYDVHTSEQAMDLQAGATPDAGQGVYGYEQWQWWDPTIVVPR